MTTTLMRIHMRILNDCKNLNTSNFVKLYYSVCVGDVEAVFCC